MPDAYGNPTWFDIQQAEQEAFQERQATEAQARRDQIGFESAKLDNAYRIASLGAKTSQQANAIQAAYNKARIALDTKRLALDTELGRGELSLRTELGRGRLGLDTELGRGELALSQGNQRIGVSESLAKMSGPENVFDQMSFLRGVASTGDLPPAYRNLALGLKTPFFQANPGMWAPTAPVPVEKQGIWQALRSEAPMAVNQEDQKEGSGGISDVLSKWVAPEPIANWREPWTNPTTAGAWQLTPSTALNPLSPGQIASTDPNSPLGRLPGDTDRLREFVTSRPVNWGPQRWGAQSIETMLPDEQAAWWAALGKQGYSIPSLQALYERSRFANSQSPLMA